MTGHVVLKSVLELHSQRKKWMMNRGSSEYFILLNWLLGITLIMKRMDEIVWS